MCDCNDRFKARYVQIDRATKLCRKVIDTTVPWYDGKRQVWCLGEGSGRREDVYLDRLVQEFAGVEMRYRYSWKGETVTRQVFAEVLEDMVSRYESMSIVGFEEDYNGQQIDWLGIIRKKLMELKGHRVCIRGTDAVL